jgi:hypothetical protein
MEAKISKDNAQISALTDRVEAIQNAFMKKEVTRLSNELNTSIREAATDFPMAMKDEATPHPDVYKLLAEHTPSGKPKYTPEEAARKVHQDRSKEFADYARKQGWDKVDDKKKQEIHQEFISKEEADKVPPVKSPDASPTSTTPPVKKQKFKNLTEGLEAFDKEHAGALVLGKGS